MDAASSRTDEEFFAVNDRRLKADGILSTNSDQGQARRGAFRDRATRARRIDSLSISRGVIGSQMPICASGVLPQLTLCEKFHIMAAGAGAGAIGRQTPRVRFCNGGEFE